MYRLFPQFIWNALLFVYGLTVLAALWVMDFIGGETSEITLIRYLGLIIFFLFSYWLGASYYYSGWRMLWRKIPVLNEWLFPDLNGIWYGNTQSNWSVIKKLKDASMSAKAINHDELNQTQLQIDPIVMHIKASLFSIKVFAKLSNTDGESYSTTASVNRHSESESVFLSYVYVQSTPLPDSTDEGDHTGAAELKWNKCLPDELNGVYWNRRSWKTGLNTAGLLNLKKVENKLEKGKCLKDYLKK